MYVPSLTTSSILPAIYPMPSSLRRPRHPHPHRFTGETPSVVHDICTDFKVFCREPRRCSKLEWRGAGVDPNSAARMGAPTTMRARERGEQRTMGAEDTSTWRGRGICGWKHTGGEWMCSSLVPRIEACIRIDPKSWLVAIGLRLAPRSSLRRKTVVSKRNQSSMHERAPLTEDPAQSSPASRCY
ncbi:hypothetical protein DFH08DRAFT_814777 [Mycena albidolilacea]|uniref:Uncharacterized protein n=1 Tax=Mycena albidolilacea TaxID=1033008 RepID=A0AAD6ZNS7_9AGAR|nr:hypothetical protein DFH08DRAFT_814777 [Mycena albidolilacea]